MDVEKLRYRAKSDSTFVVSVEKLASNKERTSSFVGKTYTETHQMMKKVYGDDCLSHSRIHEWFKSFQEGREALDDDERSGRPRNIVNEENAEIVREFIRRAKIMPEIHGIGIKNIRSVDLSNFDRKFWVHKGSAHFRTTRKRPQNF